MGAEFSVDWCVANAPCRTTVRQGSQLWEANCNDRKRIYRRVMGVRIPEQNNNSAIYQRVIVQFAFECLTIRIEACTVVEH